MANSPAPTGLVAGRRPGELFPPRCDLPGASFGVLSLFGIWIFGIWSLFLYGGYGAAAAHLTVAQGVVGSNPTSHPMGQLVEPPSELNPDGGFQFLDPEKSHPAYAFRTTTSKAMVGTSLLVCRISVGNRFDGLGELNPIALEPRREEKTKRAREGPFGLWRCQHQS